MESGKDVAKPHLTLSPLPSPDLASLVQLPSATSNIRQNYLRSRSLSAAEAYYTGSSQRLTRSGGMNHIDFDDGQIPNSSSGRGYIAEPLELHDSIIEPLPTEKIGSNLSEVLIDLPIVDHSTDLTSFGGHRDTFALLGLRRQTHHSPELPIRVFERICKFLDFHTYLAVRLSCRCWSAAITYVKPPKLPSVYFLPPEILQKIYTYLSPIDFNSSRHASKAWMTASLDKRLLSLMLSRGGWWASAIVDSALNYDRDMQREKMNDEWLMSKRLSTECSLSHNWTGNGVLSGCHNLSNLQSHISRALGVTLTSLTDFSELSFDVNERETIQKPTVEFTASVCGKFMLMIKSHFIYIYRLFDDSPWTQTHGGYLEPLISIKCPHHVLAVSMDTTAQRLAVAALLDNRMGIVCDLNTFFHSRQPSGSPTQLLYWDLSNSEAFVTGSLSSKERVTQEAFSRVANACTYSYLWPVTQSAAENGQELFNLPPSPLTCFKRDHLLDASIDNSSCSNYPNLCSDSDPPLSITICPHYRCIATGCRSGVELHWIDALNGQNISRWFPLAVPSNFLYFLPPTHSVDSTNKLKLISSAAFLGNEDELSGASVPSGNRSDLKALQGWNDGRVNSRQGVDHYQAIPLSDGIHIMFTDPVSGRLCLGIDAPLGGSTKLTRRFTFLGLDIEDDDTVGGKDSPTELVFPRVYAAGQDLRWGVRIVVGFGDQVWLFTVPPDAFGRRFSSSRIPEEVQAVINGAYSPVEDIIPIQFRGLKIDIVKGLLDVAVDASRGSLTIWAFGENGNAYTWQIDNGQQKRMRKRQVLGDGTVIDLEDADGDVIMRDAPPLDYVRKINVEYDEMPATFHDDPNGSSKPFYDIFAQQLVGGIQEIGWRHGKDLWPDEVDQNDGAASIHVPKLITIGRKIP